jgi:hypothetical protein
VGQNTEKTPERQSEERDLVTYKFFAQFQAVFLVGIQDGIKEDFDTTIGPSDEPVYRMGIELGDRIRTQILAQIQDEIHRHVLDRHLEEF